MGCALSAQSNGRALTIVLEETRDDVVWRPITDWDSTPEEPALKGQLVPGTPARGA